MLLKFKSKKPKMPTLHQESIMAILDVGASKIICLIGRKRRCGEIDLLGVGYQASKGIEYGQVTDMEAATQAIASTIHEAEKMAGLTLDAILINISGAYLRSDLLSREIRLHPTQPITSHEIGRLYTEIQALPFHEQFDLIHINPIHFLIDGLGHVKDPRGMCGSVLKGYFHIISAQKGPMKNLFAAVEHAHLQPAGLFISPIAAGESCLTEDERQLGVTLIDIGATMSDIVIYQEGAPIFVKSVNLGSHHITRDIAAGLGTSLEEAERLKTLNGSAIIDRHDHLEMLQISKTGDRSHREVSVIPKSALTHIIQPRFEEIFQHVRAALFNNSACSSNGRNIILTGGGSELVGVKELAQNVLQHPIRLAAPALFANQPEFGPTFSVAVGMLRLAFQNLQYGMAGEASQFSISSEPQRQSLFAKVSGWVKENL